MGIARGHHWAPWGRYGDNRGTLKCHGDAIGVHWGTMGMPWGYTWAPQAFLTYLALKKYAHNRVTRAAFVTITAITIGSVEGIEMDVLSTPSGGKVCGLFVEAL